jgi:hypothetical protein
MQGNLFDTDASTGAYGNTIDPPTVHRHDPDTSRIADERHRATVRPRNLDLARDLVARFPDHTADELAGILMYYQSDSPLLGGYELRRRLSDLKRTGEIVAETSRNSSVQPFTRQQTYRINPTRKDYQC